MNPKQSRLCKRNVFVLSLFLCVAVLGTWTPAQAQSGGFAYVANSGSARTIAAYTINAETGALTPVPGSPFPSQGLLGGGSIAVDPTGRFLFASNYRDLAGREPGSVSAFAINAETGALTPVPGSPFDTGGQTIPGSVAVDPTGQFAYVALSGASSVLAFTIDAETGALTQIGQRVPARLRPHWVAVEPMGQFVYVTNQGDRSVSAYRINAETGGLTEIEGSPFQAGEDPLGMAVHPSGQFVYVAVVGEGTVRGYSIDAATGALTQIGNFPAGAAPVSVAVDPTGQFAYVSNASFPNGRVTALSIDADTGALTLVGSFAAGRHGSAVAVDPTGQFVYVPDSQSFNVRAYIIDSESGALTEIAGSPFPTEGSFPWSVVTTAGPQPQAAARCSDHELSAAPEFAR